MQGFSLIDCVAKLYSCTWCVIGRLSGRRWGHTVPSLTWWRMWEWEFTPCWVDPAPGAGWPRAQTTPSWSANPPTQVRPRDPPRQNNEATNSVNRFNKKRNASVRFCLSKWRRCKHRGPRLGLRELQHGERGMHLAKRRKDSGQRSAAPVFLVPPPFQSFSFIWRQQHKDTGK